jgi:hypothetical protein
MDLRHRSKFTLVSVAAGCDHRPVSSSPTKSQVYAIRGEVLSVCARVDYVLRRLDDAFVRVSESKEQAEKRRPIDGAARQWDRLKGHANQRGLNNSLLQEMQAMGLYFKTRQLSAHGTVIFASAGGDDPQIFRLYYDGDDHNVVAVTLDDLRSELATVRAGHDALHRFGQALDDDNRDVLGSWNAILRAIVIGRT